MNLIIGLLLLSYTVAGQCIERVYSTLKSVSVMEATSISSKKVGTLAHSKWAHVLESKKDWSKIRSYNGLTGFVSNRFTTNFWIKIYTKEHKIFLMKDKKIIKTYTVSFGFNSKGDGTTTLEGRFYLQKHFGDKTLLLAYPSRHNARLGLEKKLISKDQYYKIIRAINEGETPPQNTKLGGSVRIHDGGTHKNCALACFKMNDKDISELYKLMPKGLIIVEVYNSQAQDEKINKSNYTSTMILDNLPKVLGQKAKYTKKAMSYIPLTYPNGDFDPKHAVCTDVIIRVLRGAKLDLQALLHEDIIVNPTRYKSVKKANYHIDHRRTRVLKYYFDHNSKVLSNNVLSNDWLPGDIVLFDTGVRNGTIFDHIGIVAQKKSALGRHLVFNIWTEGDETSVMDLLTGVYPTVVGHYRMLNPLFYL